MTYLERNLKKISASHSTIYRIRTAFLNRKNRALLASTPPWSLQGRSISTRTKQKHNEKSKQK